MDNEQYGYELPREKVGYYNDEIYEELPDLPTSPIPAKPLPPKLTFVRPRRMSSTLSGMVEGINKRKRNKIILVAVLSLLLCIIVGAVTATVLVLRSRASGSPYDAQESSISENDSTVLPSNATKCHRFLNMDNVDGEGFSSEFTRFGEAEANCCKLCIDITGCLGYAWSNYSSGTCWFKKSTGPLIPKEGVIVGNVIFHQ